MYSDNGNDQGQYDNDGPQGNSIRDEETGRNSTSQTVTLAPLDSKITVSTEYHPQHFSGWQIHETLSKRFSLFV